MLFLRSLENSCVMLWLLVLVLPGVACSALTQNLLQPDNDHRDGAVAVTTRPHIYYCRSPNMEVFTCWWHPLDNNSESDDNITYSLTYSLEKGPRHECPDYVTGGPNSCHFDSGHTSIWTRYCMNVVARTSHGVFSSKDHCLEVADIVETEAPVNLTYTLLNETEEEAGRTAMVSWVYPNPSHIQYGWITLVFELQYRHIAEPNNWKVKGLLREPCLELLDLPVGEYIVRVRCRSRNNGLWSKWSTPVLLCVPVKSTPVAVAVTTRPHIYYCHSPNMEVFTCWWHPLDNNSESDDNITYSLTYFLENGPRRECPDYVTGGPNSCHFDSGHTSIWTRYCMNVMARTSHGVFSSKDHCLDVADIVETEAPVNLTYTLLNETEEEAGRTAMVSWVYPNPSHIQYGWITLVFELQYRRIAEPNNWKVKGLLREPCLELLDLPVGEYIVRVRCRSRNNGLWSKWSTPVLLCVPVKSTPGAVAVTNQPHIYYCRSPNMEVFTCWWHSLDNNSESDDNITYSLTYSLENGPRRECPDYVTGGPNSCHFDSGHTSIWTRYCMNVMARTSHGVFSSKDHCLDVADIVETEAPVNLTYTLLNETEEEAGRTAMVSWVYPNPSHIQYGWITLVFELQYRRIAEPNNWKVKGLLREPCLELLDLPVGEYIVRVRCRSRNNGFWSKWSTPVLLCVPVKSTPGAVAVTTRPHIYYCRSPNMEVFTCWWHPLDNNSESDDNITYSLTYSLEKGPRRECPDYVTGGPNSCHFDSGHTSIWTIYCMNVVARTSHGVFSSKDHCLDVADIVETEAPVNLTYTLLNETEEEAGRTAMVSWVYPNPSHIQYGWITLVFELQYRRIAEPNNWKVKGLLREPCLELLDLPVGEYIVRVRCRSRNNGLWSKWSTPVLLCIPVKSTPDKLLALLLVTGVGVMLLLVIGFGMILQGKRIKAFLLPPIPKPRIKGINPLLLKKGGFDEINRHFISFHGYKPPSYSEEEVWDSVSMDDNQSLQAPLGILAVRKEDYDMAIHSQLLVQTTSSHAPYTPVPASYTPVPAPYCQAPVEAFPTPWEWPTANPDQPELLVFPGTDYSMMVDPTPVPPPNQQAPPPSSTQGFYTCVNMLGDNGQVHLVPCLPTHLKHSPYVQLEEELEEGGLEKRSQLDDYLAKKMEAVANGSAPGETVVETEVETE
ncbi:uncharacterized protein LOC115127219 [Oncorhynchus nerka]|uniref:uncharacterized protein LOC115127219 n=1 Tax=Oncorhynchus nerka TaxID=8023 RepID=UPI0031B7EFB9